MRVVGRIVLYALLALAGIYVFLEAPVWHRFEVEERYSFAGLDPGTAVRLGFILPRCGPYQRVDGVMVSWDGAIELEVDSPVEIFRLEGTAHADGRQEGVATYTVGILDGPARWDGEAGESDLAPARFIESDHPKIVAEAARLASGRSRDDAFRIFSFTAEHVSWGKAKPFVRDGVAKAGGGEESALRTYESGVGGCLEFANLSVALSRASGIPARTIDGLAFPSLSASKAVTATWGHPAGAHAWIEVRTEEGWEMADPSWAAGDRQIRRARYFGRNDGQHLSYGEVGESESRHGRLVAWGTEGLRGVGAMSSPLRFVAAVGSETGHVTPSVTVRRIAPGRLIYLMVGMAALSALIVTVERRQHALKLRNRPPEVVRSALPNGSTMEGNSGGLIMSDRCRRYRTLVLAVFLALLADARADTPASNLYLRGVKTHQRALEILDGRARQRQSDAVLVVFDTVSFSPPPLLNEFRLIQDYRGDIEAWLDALDGWQTRLAAARAAAAPGPRDREIPGNVFVATTLSSSPHRLGAPGWREALARDLQRRWWEEKNLPDFEPATSWMARQLQKVPGPNRTLGLITGELVPERLADASRDATTRFLPPEQWRRKLLPVGEYWDEEAVGSCLVKRGTVLDVIAPEVRFCDFWPVQELPELPWVSRPRIPVVPGGSKIPQTRRFHSGSALGQMLCGSYVFFNTDTPSGFGYWPFARAATITNGSYIFYPFVPTDFLDACPYDPSLMKHLAPESGSRRDILKSKAGDPALQALLDAAHLVMAKTPWHDGPPRATGWAEIASVNPVTLESRYRARDKPSTWLGSACATPGAAESRGRELAKILPLYDRAIEKLKSVQSDIAAGKLPRPHRRSRANLRLGIFWFEMSAYHLHALSLYLMDIRKNIPEAQQKKMNEFGVVFHRAIRMSDCLPGYEGRSISRERDLELQVGPPNPICGAQGNLLPLQEADPDYRALRHPGEVLKNLDPRLMSRALSMIDAARDVMRHEGESPWGWVVYYSEAITYTWYGVPPVLTGARRPATDDPEGVATPRPKTQPGGPSSGKWREAGLPGWVRHHTGGRRV